MNTEMSSPLLRVTNLVVEIKTRRGVLRPVNGISFELGRGEILGLVGESGAGKSITGAAIIRLLEGPVSIAGGEVWLGDQRIDNLSNGDLRSVRGRRIGSVFQDPLTSLNPLMRIGDQLMETIMVHLGVTRAQARKRAIAALEDVGIAAAERRIDAYPHEFSGGMRQRVVIALALAAEPELVIADEPTTALDVSVQAQVLSLLKSICRQRGTGIILITHDMGVIAETTDRVAVLYAGRMAEIGSTQAVLTKPQHPYTAGLVAATPRINDDRDRLLQIPGAMPSLGEIPNGCAFHPRCPQRFDQCETGTPRMTEAGASRVACFMFESKAAS